MIAYFDTSAIVPLLIQEAGSDAAGQLWDEASRLVSVRLAHVEARAALAQAARTSRISAQNLASARRELQGLVVQLEFVEVDDELVRQAADLAESQALRAYDAVHLAAALEVLDPDLVLVAGDHALLAAAQASGVSVAAIS